MPRNENQNQNNVITTELEREVKVQTEIKPDDWLYLECLKRIIEDKDGYSKLTNFESFIINKYL